MSKDGRETKQETGFRLPNEQYRMSIETPDSKQSK